MKPALLLPLALLFAVACGEEDKTDDSTPDSDTDADTDADTDTDADADADADADTDADTDALPDLTQDLDQDACEDAPYGEGATTYYVGTYLWDDATHASGAELWIWYATSEWEAVGGADCEVVWDVTATRGATTTCPGADFSLSVSAEVNAAATTCPEEAWTAYTDPTWTTHYEVDTTDAGTTIWYFTGSCGRMGDGFWNTAGQNFVTTSSCLWF
ncbi:MAG: hypothetical protein ABIO70_18670 [Pseudomonadota bacterium]